MVIGYKSDDYVSSESEEFLEKLAHANYDGYIPLDSKEYNDPLLNERFADETTTSSKSLQTGLSDGPMDSPWSMKCHDTHHTGRSKVSTEDNPPGIYKWRFECDTIAGGIITGEEGTIYFGDFDQYLYAVNPNGTMKWRYRTDMWIWSSPAIGVDGTIYVTSYDDFLYAVNSNGTLKWKFCAYDSISSSPIIASDGTIYFGTMGTGCNIIALFPNGTEKWRYSTGYYVTSDPAIGDDGTIYIGSGDNYLYAINANGTLKWRFLTGDYVKGPPSIADDGTIYVGSYDGYLYAINPDGTEKWRRGIGWGSETNPSIGVDGTIYIGGEDLYATYPDGTAKWDFDLGSDRWIGQSSAAISADGTIYVGVTIGDAEGAEIIAVCTDGTEKWREYISHYDCFSSPCIGSDGTVYIGCNEDLFGDKGYLYAFGTLDPNAPNAPTIIGENEGVAGEEYEYTLSTIEPNGDDVYYYIEWGDGEYEDWFGPFASGEEVVISHTWDEQDTYTIRARAKDTDNLWGPWGELEVTMPVNQPVQYPLLELFRERFPLLYQLFIRVLEVNPFDR